MFKIRCYSKVNKLSPPDHFALNGRPKYTLVTEGSRPADDKHATHSTAVKQKEIKDLEGKCSVCNEYAETERDIDVPPAIRGGK